MEDKELYQTFKLLLEGINDKITTVKEDVYEIKTQTKLTNGRVNKLESWKDKISGAGIVVGFIFTCYITPLIVNWLKNLI